MKDNKIKLFENQGMKVRAILNEDGSISISAEDASREYGFVQIKNGKEYIRWERVNRYCKELGMLKEVECDSYIPIEMVVALQTKSKSLTKHIFLKELFEEIGKEYVSNEAPRKEIKFLEKLEQSLIPFNIKGVKQYKILNYRIDYYIKSLNISIEYDENNHKYYSYENTKVDKKK